MLRLLYSFFFIYLVEMPNILGTIRREDENFYFLISLLLCFCSVAHEHKVHDSSKKSANGVRKIVGPDLKSSLIEILKADELLHESF